VWLKQLNIQGSLILPIFLQIFPWDGIISKRRTKIPSQVLYKENVYTHCLADLRCLLMVEEMLGCDPRFINGGRSTLLMDGGRNAGL
jgi:hypothetical protein